MSPDLEKLVSVVDELDPNTLTPTDIAEIKAWGADQVGFVLVDVETQKIVYATPGAEKVFGYVTDEMVDKDLTDLVPEDLRSVHVHHVEDYSKAMQPRSMGRRDSTLYGRERDGHTFPVEISLFPRQFRKRRLVLANVVRLSKEV